MAIYQPACHARSLCWLIVAWFCLLSSAGFASHPVPNPANTSGSTDESRATALAKESTPTTAVTTPKRSFISKAWGQFTGDGDPKDIGLLVYPTIAYAPETQWDFGFSAVYVYYAENDPKNRLSELSGFAFVTQAKQYGMWLEHTLYSDKNKWFFFGRATAQSFPMQFFGVGEATRKDPVALIEGNFVLVRERVLRELRKNVYFGLNFDLQHLGSARYVANPDYEDRQAPLGATGSTNFGIGLGFIYDTRHNPMNVRNGLMAEVGLLGYPSWTSTFPMGAAYFDGRACFSLSATQVIGFQVRGDFTFGESVPFNQLSQLGGAMMMRGYYTGRFRDRNALTAQVEYRILPLWWRFGVATFASIGSVANDLGFDTWHWSVGGGPRFLLFPLKDIYMRIDFGFTTEQWGTYFYVGESF